ncbi:uncharacterized protein B0H18DRAFT_871225 [Fomitopsis serialis]|uniref:uncharacterized protein n=1 Tax=Fomitopsis serialis TaxID=139415 RepID=UPI002007F80B|nr:uncharacterized protein B0H18DRAFT_871225 [Neoantrodia serialis]KAH9932479.1 hypothetical protein B0H18DRAFT_871225 [Neoantrodia serialis]
MNTAEHPPQDALTMLGILPWSGNLQGFDFPESVETLVHYMTNEWLSDSHEDQMLTLLRQDITLSSSHTLYEVENAYFGSLLRSAYASREHGEYEESRHFARVRGVGQALAEGRRSAVAFILNVNRNHWVAVIVDFCTSEILWGDPLGHPPSAADIEALDWWTALHSGYTFAHRTLMVTRQTDDFSCGLLAFGALAHYCLPEKYPLVAASEVADERLRMFLAIARRHLSEVSNLGNHA